MGATAAEGVAVTGTQDAIQQGEEDTLREELRPEEDIGMALRQGGGRGKAGRDVTRVMTSQQKWPIQLDRRRPPSRLSPTA